ncbi:zinc ribbon domain-containing protein [Microcoleus sp. PH2017_14_LAR_D_A]
MCANCGHKKDMPLSVRTYDCPACGLSVDRDLNASLNILNWEPKAIGG